MNKLIATQIITGILFFLAFFGLILFIINGTPAECSDQHFIDYAQTGVVLLVDCEAGAVCWLRGETGIFCLPLDQVNREGLVRMMNARPVQVEPDAGRIPAPWSKDEYPVRLEEIE